MTQSSMQCIRNKENYNEVFKFNFSKKVIVEDYLPLLIKSPEMSTNADYLIYRKEDSPYLNTLVSGSPIIQNGKLVGAVTHVLISEPTKGYGIFIENMLNAA